jgi:hypothetical protein
VVFRGEAPEAVASVGPALIRSDEREIALKPLAQLPVNISQREQYLEPLDFGVAVAAYTVDFSTLRSIAASRELGLSLPQDLPDASFMLLRDGRPALAQFVQQLNGL